MPVSLKGKNIEEIINEWSAELEEQVAAFNKHAAALAAWDRTILHNRACLLSVEEELGVVAASQEAMDRKLAMLETHHKEVHDALVSIEGEAERLVAAERGLLDEDALERDRLYARAEALSTALVSLGEELGSAVADVNELSGAAAGDPASPLGAVVRILNNQLLALSQVESRVSSLEGELRELQGGGPGPGQGAREAASALSAAGWGRGG